MMDLDEMKQKWEAQDKKLDETIRLNRQMLSIARLDKTQSALTRLAVGSALEAALWLVIIVALGNFIYENWSQPHLAVAGIVLDVYSIAMLNSLIRQIVASRLIDYGKPIAVIQKQIEALRILRIRMVQWAVLAGLAVWVAALIVIFKAAFGVDIYEPRWIWSNVAFGVALIPLAVWLSKRFAAQMDRSPFIQGVMRSLAGYNLTSAAGFLASLAEFQHE